MKISLCMIVGNEEKFLPRCLLSFKDAFDELSLVVASGSSDPGFTEQIARKFCEEHGKSFIVSEHKNSQDKAEWPHVDDFATARNKSFLQSSGEWVLWADADDVLGEGSAKAIRDHATSDVADVYAFAYQTGNGLCLYRDRLARRGVGRWMHPIHEQWKFSCDELKKHRFFMDPKVLYIHACGYKEDSYLRNQRILTECLSRTAENLFYLHQDYFLRGDYENAIAAAKTALAHDDLGEAERYNMLCNLSLMVKESSERKRWAMSAVSLCPWRREALFNLAMISVDLGKPMDALAFVRMYSHLPVPDPAPWNHKNAVYGADGVLLGARVLRMNGDARGALESERNLFALCGLRISLIHATRGRPEKCLDTKAEWFAKADNPGGVEHIFGVDHDDSRVLEEIRRGGHRHVVCNPGGTTPRAYNRAAEVSEGQVLIAMSDDAHPPPHWDTLIWKRLESVLGSEAVLAVSDGHRTDHVLCHQIMTRSRFVKQGHIFSEDYESMYADDEFSWRAYRDGIVIEAKDIVIEHRHPVFKTGRLDTDSTYAHTNDPGRYERGKATFLKRNPDFVPHVLASDTPVKV